MYKSYCIISKEAIAKFHGNRGKMMAQAGHAFLHSAWDAENRFPNDAKAYKNSGKATKVTLVVETDQDILDLHDAYKNVCGVSLVIDAGLTVFKEPTMTCLGISSIHVDKIGVDLSNLKPLI